MDRWLGRYSDHAYALMRIVLGFLFACYGAQKVLGAFGGLPDHGGGAAPFGTLIWIGGAIELVGGLLLLVGLFTSFTAFICSGQMAVAYWKFHFDAAAPLPIQNHGDLAVVFCFVFLFMATKGSGPWSLDRSRRRA